MKLVIDKGSCSWYGCQLCCFSGCLADHIDELLTPAPLADKALENHAIFQVPIIIIPGLNHNAVRMQLETLLMNPGIKPEMVVVRLMWILIDRVVVWDDEQTDKQDNQGDRQKCMPHNHRHSQPYQHGDTHTHTCTHAHHLRLNCVIIFQVMFDEKFDEPAALAELFKFKTAQLSSSTKYVCKCEYY